MVDDGGLPTGPFRMRVPPHDKRPSGCTQWVSATPARKIPRDVNEDVREHVMHTEEFSVPEETQRAIVTTKEAGGRVIAVGTTAARALETWGKSGESSGESSLFIYPGYEFSVVDGMVTNFHLPGSTLLMLVSAMAGRETISSAYKAAITERYRFFSYGDAMLIV